MRACLLLAALLATPAAAQDKPPDAFAHARRLGRGINLGNALEAPKEGDWGVRLEAGKHAKALNELLELFSSDLENEVKMKEFLGHTPLQVFFGAVLGAAVALIIG